MADKNKLENFAELLTGSLKDDAELRLDVKEEIKSHLEETAEAFSAGGKSSEEAAELAIKAFGPADAISEDLLNANRRKMKTRHRVKLFFRYAIIPASVIIALLFSCFPRFSVLDITHNYFSSGDPCSLNIVHHLVNSSYINTIKPLKKLSLKISDKIFNGYYISEFITFNLFSGEDAIKEIKLAEKYEPENARYNYLLCGALLEKAVAIKCVDATDKKGGKIHEDICELKDMQFLDQAFEEFLKGLKKPYYKTYTMETIKRRLAGLPPSIHIEDNLTKIVICAGILLPDFSHLCKIAKAIPFYAEKLAEEGQKDKALQLLEARYKIIKDMEADSITLVEILFINSIAGMGEKYAEAYRKIGKPELAEKTIALGRILQDPVNKVFPRDAEGKRIYAKKEKAFEQTLRQKAGTMNGNTFSISASEGNLLSEDDLKKGCELDYIFLERITFHILLVTLTFFMLSSAITVLYFYIRQKKTLPLLLMPNWLEILKIILFGILLPTALYLAYTRFTYLSHRDFNLIFNQFRGVGEMILLAISIVFITVSLARKLVTRRCIEIGIKTKFKPSMKSEKIMYSMLAALWLSCIFLPKAWMPATVIIIGISALFFLVYALFSQWREYAVVSGAIARSIIPVYSLSIILLCLLVQPFLEMRERYLVQNDPFVIRTTDDKIGFTNIEVELVKRIKKDYEEAFRKAGL